MKLIEKNNRQFFQLALVLLAVGSLVFYWSVAWVIQEELDEQLSHDQERVIRLIAAQRTVFQLPPLVEVNPINEPQIRQPIFKDTVLFDPIEAEEEPFRQLIIDTLIRDQVYQIITRSSLVESEDLLFAVGMSTLVLCIVLFLGFYWFNRRQSLKLWEPFYTNLSAISRFSLEQPTSVQLSESQIFEFQELKNVLEQLTGQVQKDYNNLKTFTENASHEIQTPLAIIRSKIEVLLAHGNFDKAQLESIQEIYESTNRLSRLNQKLLLLAKIENRQFVDQVEVSFSQLVNGELAFLSELIKERNLHIEVDTKAEFQILISQTLAEIMVRNLLENAIKYSKVGDRILIQLFSDKLVFANPGENSIPDPEKLFQRFYKYTNHKQSLGLGLAIVKNISIHYGLQVIYSFEKGLHWFIVQS